MTNFPAIHYLAMPFFFSFFFTGMEKNSNFKAADEQILKQIYKAVI